MKQLTKMFEEFNEMYGLSTKELDHNLDGMREVIGSEYDEWDNEIVLSNKKYVIVDRADFVKEGLDIVYATLQQLTERGVDVGAGLAELHRSNMSKTVSADQVMDEVTIAEERYPDVEAIALADGRYVLKSPSIGKVVKPTTYSAANISPDIIKKKERECVLPYIPAQ